MVRFFLQSVKYGILSAGIRNVKGWTADREITLRWIVRYFQLDLVGSICVFVTLIWLRSARLEEQIEGSVKYALRIALMWEKQLHHLIALRADLLTADFHAKLVRVQLGLSGSAYEFTPVVLNWVVLLAAPLCYSRNVGEQKVP